MSPLYSFTIFGPSVFMSAPNSAPAQVCSISAGTLLLSGNTPSPVIPFDGIQQRSLQRRLFRSVGLVRVPTSTSCELLHSVTAGDEVKRPVVGVSKLDMLMQVTQQTDKQLPDSGLDSGFVNTGRRRGEKF